MEKQVDRVQLDISELKEIVNKNLRRKKIIQDDLQENELKEFNLKLAKKIDYMQKRERELLEKVMVLKANKT